MPPFLRQIIIAVLLAAPFSVRADYTAIVNPGSVLVTNFEGWGSSLCWWANVVGGYANRDDYANLAFNQLKLNIVRYNIGGGENPALTNSMTTHRVVMQGFEADQWCLELERRLKPTLDAQGRPRSRR